MWGTSNSSADWNLKIVSNSKKFQNQSGNVVAVPPQVHRGHGGEEEHHHDHLVHVRHIKFKSRLKFKNYFWF